jgi:hypothetical protein
MHRIEPDGRLSVTEEFRAQALTLATQILPLFQIEVLSATKAHHALKNARIEKLKRRF